MKTNVPTTGSSRTNVSVHEEVARRAYELWEQEGRGHGEHQRHWQEAERQLHGTPSPAQDSVAHAGAPAKHGNPAYPSLAAREATVADNTGRDEPVKKRPADEIG